MSTQHKRILVLANSIKNSGRCVAGLEVVDRRIRKGHWIRPVSSCGRGELLPRHMRTSLGEAIRPLQIVDVPIVRKLEDPAHPEDWLVSGEPWGIVEHIGIDVVPKLTEEPLSLWLEDAPPTDRASAAFIGRQVNHGSLHLIRPDRFRVRYWREYNPSKGYCQKRTRAQFRYRGIEYEMGLTDPELTARLRFPPEGAQPNVSRLSCGDRCALCVSLTPLFRGFHYKIVATVLRLP